MSGEKFSAIYTYVAQYEDELSFEAGDIVMVQAKDEADWWRGECKGKTGVFPSNYVEPLKCESTFGIISPSSPSLVLSSYNLPVDTTRHSSNTVIVF